MLTVLNKKKLDNNGVDVFNFKVEDFHTYYVGENGILVHNANYDSEGGTGSLLNKTPEEISSMTRKELENSIPDNWDFQNHNGRIYIKDENGNFRVRIDPPDKVTNYTHIIYLMKLKILWIFSGRLFLKKTQRGIYLIKISKESKIMNVEIIQKEIDETDANWRKLSSVKNMKEPQLGYYGQDIVVSESEEADFYKVDMELSIMKICIECKNILVEKISKEGLNLFWKNN